MVQKLVVVDGCLISQQPWQMGYLFCLELCVQGVLEDFSQNGPLVALDASLRQLEALIFSPVSFKSGHFCRLLHGQHGDTDEVALPQMIEMFEMAMSVSLQPLTREDVSSVTSVQVAVKKKISQFLETI